MGLTVRMRQMALSGGKRYGWRILGYPHGVQWPTVESALGSMARMSVGSPADELYVGLPLKDEELPWV